MSLKSQKQLDQLVTDLERLKAGLTEQSSEVGPDLAGETAVLTSLIADLRATSQEQVSLQAQAEAKTEELQAKMKTAAEKRNGLYLQLKGRLGRKNQKLEAFGIIVKKE